MERLFRQNSYLQKEFNMKPSKLFIGTEDYTEIMGGDEMRQMLQFNTTYNFGDRYGTHIIGLEVKVIPWMRGIIVMP